MNGREQPVLVDLSHRIAAGMITYKGLPGPIICDYLSREASRERYAPGTEFQIGRIDMVANTGTYIDSPFHRYADGDDLAALKLESFAALEAVVVRAPYERDLAVGEKAFGRLDVRGRAVLVHTGWDVHWLTPAYYESHPFLTAGAAQFLADAGATLVGIDSHNIDDTSRNDRPVHSTLLARGIPIVEHLCNLRRVPDRDARFTAAPAAMVGVGTFPVRAFAELGRSR
jgi:kynurenine formamidase